MAGKNKRRELVIADVDFTLYEPSREILEEFYTEIRKRMEKEFPEAKMPERPEYDKAFMYGMHLLKEEAAGAMLDREKRIIPHHAWPEKTDSLEARIVDVKNPKEVLGLMDDFRIMEALLVVPVLTASKKEERQENYGKARSIIDEVHRKLGSESPKGKIMRNPEKYGIAKNRLLRDFLEEYPSVALTNSQEAFANYVLESMGVRDSFTQVISEAKKPYFFYYKLDKIDEHVNLNGKSPDRIWYIADNLLEVVIAKKKIEEKYGTPVQGVLILGDAKLKPGTLPHHLIGKYGIYTAKNIEEGTGIVRESQKSR